MEYRKKSHRFELLSKHPLRAIRWAASVSDQMPPSGSQIVLHRFKESEEAGQIVDTGKILKGIPGKLWAMWFNSLLGQILVLLVALAGAIFGLIRGASPTLIIGSVTLVIVTLQLYMTYRWRIADAPKPNDMKNTLVRAPNGVIFLMDYNGHSRWIPDGETIMYLANLYAVTDVIDVSAETVTLIQGREILSVRDAYRLMPTDPLADLRRHLEANIRSEWALDQQAVPESIAIMLTSVSDVSMIVEEAWFHGDELQNIALHSSHGTKGTIFRTVTLDDSNRVISPNHPARFDIKLSARWNPHDLEVNRGRLGTLRLRVTSDGQQVEVSFPI